MKAMGLACLGIGIAVAGSLSLASARGFRREVGPPENPRQSGPQLFGPGVLSTPDDEFGGTLSPDGRTFLYCKSVPRSQFYVIVESHHDGGRWSAPRIASFSGRYRDSDPVFSRDGSRVYFVSDRPVAGVDRKNFDVWSVARRDESWGEPENLGPPVNSDKNEYFVSFTRDGTIYFTSAREGSRGPIDVWRSQWADGRYGEPENLGETINGKNWLNGRLRHFHQLSQGRRVRPPPAARVRRQHRGPRIQPPNLVGRPVALLHQRARDAHTAAGTSLDP